MAQISSDDLRFNRYALSQQESKVLALAMSGRIDKQIATEMGISLGTVRVYWKRIRMKVGGTRSEVIASLARTSLKLDLDDQRTRGDKLAHELDQSAVRERKLQVYEAAFGSFASPMAVLDGPTGEILRVNLAFAKIHGYSEDEMEGLESSELLEPMAQAQYAKQARAAAREDKLLDVETVHRRKNGGTFKVRVTLACGGEVCLLTVFV